MAKSSESIRAVSRLDIFLMRMEAHLQNESAPIIMLISIRNMAKTRKMIRKTIPNFYKKFKALSCCLKIVHPHFSDIVSPPKLAKKTKSISPRQAAGVARLRFHFESLGFEKSLGRE